MQFLFIVQWTDFFKKPESQANDFPFMKPTLEGGPAGVAAAAVGEDADCTFVRDVCPPAVVTGVFGSAPGASTVGEMSDVTTGSEEA